jgi:hypothetical protein
MAAGPSKLSHDRSLIDGTASGAQPKSKSKSK